MFLLLSPLLGLQEFWEDTEESLTTAQHRGGGKLRKIRGLLCRARKIVTVQEQRWEGKSSLEGEGIWDSRRSQGSKKCFGNAGSAMLSTCQGMDTEQGGKLLCCS